MKQPNIVVILADDLGFSDIGPFGSEIETPALERLASRGVRMSSFYVTPRCSPSRAALLTGMQPHSVGIGVLTGDNRPAGYPGSLSTTAPTLAELLRDEGYATGLFGKWHLSHNVDQPDETWPTHRGFGEFRGIISGSSSYYAPPLVEGDGAVPSAELGEDFYFTDDIGRSSASFIKRHATDAAPFFLFASFTAPHWPLHAPPSLIAQYRERYADDINAIRAARLARMQEAGIVEESHQLPPMPDDAPDHLDAWWVERMATYAAQVEALDSSIGDICAALAESGIEDDTLVIFLSDNGGCGEEISPSTTLPPSACPRTTPDGREVVVGNVPGVFPGPVDTFQSYGAVWGAVSNTPFRKWKRWVHEGGIASPLIASWPSGGIAAGAPVIAQPGHVIDIVPTILEAVGQIPQTEGQSLLPWWRNLLAPASETTLYWEHIGNAAIRHGRWKLVREWPSEWELYDIESDRAESLNLATSHPDVVRDLSRRHQEWATERGVVPWENIVSDFVSRGQTAARAANS